MLPQKDEYFCIVKKKPHKERPPFVFKTPMKGLDYKQKRVLITGASNGIGAELAIRLSRLGARLGLMGRSKKRLLLTAEKCSKDKGGEIILLKASLADTYSITQAVRDFLSNYRGIDMLLNCSGSYVYSTIETTSMKEYDKVMNHNLRGVFLLTMSCMPDLVASKGCVITIAGTEGIRPIPNCVVYSIAQQGLIQFSRTIAALYGPQGVRSIVVNPSHIQEKFHANKGMRCSQYVTFMRNIRKLHPLRRVGKIQDIVNMIIYAGSSNGKFLTGIDADVSGGFHTIPLTKQIYDVFLLPMF